MYANRKCYRKTAEKTVSEYTHIETQRSEAIKVRISTMPCPVGGDKPCWLSMAGFCSCGGEGNREAERRFPALPS